MESFNCPITYERMQDPVMAMDGHTYERTAIEQWFGENSTNNRVLSPMTGVSMGLLLIPNHTLRRSIAEYNEPKQTEVARPVRENVERIQSFENIDPDSFWRMIRSSRYINNNNIINNLMNINNNINNYERINNKNFISDINNDIIYTNNRNNIDTEETN